MTGKRSVRKFQSWLPSGIVGGAGGRVGVILGMGLAVDVELGRQRGTRARIGVLVEVSRLAADTVIARLSGLPT